MTDTHTGLARKAIEQFVKNKEEICPPEKIPPAMSRQAGVFVSIHAKSGQLRGCIGTFLPTKKNIAGEIISNAMAAAQDPRFPPISEKELPNLTYKVDVLSDLKPAQKEDLDPKKYGLLISAREGRRGLLLPDLPGVESVDQQIEICRQKAGIGPEEKVDYQTFTVKRHE
jgi:AmmeMemoRadiSam system protein A